MKLLLLLNLLITEPQVIESRISYDQIDGYRNRVTNIYLSDTMVVFSEFGNYASYNIISVKENRHTTEYFTNHVVFVHDKRSGGSVNVFLLDNRTLIVTFVNLKRASILSPLY